MKNQGIVLGAAATALLHIWGIAASEPSLVLLDGKIITVDEQFSIQQAIAIDGSKIVAVGSDARVRALAGPATQVIDLHGKTVIPGLIDNHNHFIRGTEHWGNEARLEGVADRKVLLEKLRTKANSLPPGEWLFTLGGWYEDQLLGDRRGLTRAELDAIAPGRPAFIQAKYDHAFVNSAWLKSMGIPVRLAQGAGSGTTSVQSTQAGAAHDRSLAESVERDAHGRATGRINGGITMIERAIRRFPSVSEPVQIEGIKAAMAYYNSVGLTTVYDPGGVGIQDASYARIERMARRGELTLRVMYTLGEESIGHTPQDARPLLAKMKETRPFQGDEWFNCIALGELYYTPFHWDDIIEPTHPTPDDVDVAREILTAAAAGGWPVQTHAVQPSTIDRLLDILEGVNTVHPLRGLRWSITHADNIGASQIERARRLGMNLQLRSIRVLGTLDAAVQKYGREATERMPPLRLVQDSGLMFGLGTDGTKAAQINPFVTLWWATSGKALNGERSLSEVLTREEALIAHTRSNAFLMFQESYIGAIKPGLLADLLVLDRDYLTVPVDEIKDILPVATVVGGKVVQGRLQD